MDLKEEMVGWELGFFSSSLELCILASLLALLSSDAPNTLTNSSTYNLTNSSTYNLINSTICYSINSSISYLSPTTNHLNSAL